MPILCLREKLCWFHLEGRSILISHKLSEENISVVNVFITELC